MMNGPQVCIAQEAVKSFILRFSDKPVFKDADIICPNVFKSPVISRYVTCINDVDKITAYSELSTLLQLVYLEFVRNTPEKREVHVFKHITEVYQRIKEIVDGDR